MWQSSLIEYFCPSVTQIECREPFPKKPNGVEHHLFKHGTIYVNNATLLHWKEISTL